MFEQINLNLNGRKLIQTFERIFLTFRIIFIGSEFNFSAKEFRRET